MTIKLVAIDIDATLINDQRQITPKTKAALEALQNNKGLKSFFVLAGR